MEASERLRSQIEHIVVLMMENRSFDHMLGYLSLPDEHGGRGRSDVDGLTGPQHNFNCFDDHPPYTIRAMEKEGGLTKVQDPGHTGADVGQQMAHGMSGFVTNYLTTRPYQDGHDVMRYQVPGTVPIYDFFAEQFAICDRWFCSVPGSTWPNRVTALAGEALSRDNKFPPIYSCRSFVRTLEDHGVSWRWYSSDPGSLRLVDARYRVGFEDHFAYVEKPSLVQPRTFYTDAMKEELPNVAWIDPNFVDLGGLQGANDDHPPTDVMAGQSFVMKIYQALKDSALWEKSILVIVYDEHGGFYDHVDPTVGLPVEFTEKRAEFRHFGPRVPAIVVSPFVEAGAAFGSAQDNDPRFLFDHTALIKTILVCFADSDYRGLPQRVASSSHLGHLLTDGTARSGPVIGKERVDAATDWWADHIEIKLKHPSATVPALQELGIVEGPSGAQRTAQGILAAVGRAVDWVKRRFGRKPKPEAEAAAEDAGPRPTVTVLTETTELQAGMAAAARHLREERKLPRGQP